MSLGEGLEQFTDVALRLGRKLVGVSGLGEEGGERPARGCGDAGGDRERGGLQELLQGVGREPPDPVLLQEIAEGSEWELETLRGVNSLW